MFRKVRRHFRAWVLRKRFERLLRQNGRMLHVGCGDDYLEGYINMDADPSSRADLVAEISSLALFPSDCVDTIESYHFFEHLHYFQAKRTLRECYRLLAPGGIMVIELPDLEVCIRELGKHFTGNQIDLAMVGLYGYPPDVSRYGDFFAHKWGWTFETLSAELKQLGFREIKRHEIRQKHREAAGFNRDMQLHARKMGPVSADPAVAE